MRNRCSRVRKRLIYRPICRPMPRAAAISGCLRKSAGVARGCFGGGLRGAMCLWRFRSSLPDGYVLNIPPGFRIGGVVQDESGQPVAGAGIQILFDGTSNVFEPRVPARTVRPARQWLCHCGYDRQRGPLVFRALFQQTATLESSSTILIFQGRFYTDDRSGRTNPAGDTLALDDLRAGRAVVVLQVGLTLRGEVTDEHGYRVAGARVWHVPSSLEAHTRLRRFFRAGRPGFGKGHCHHHRRGFRPAANPGADGLQHRPVGRSAQAGGGPSPAGRGRCRFAPVRGARRAGSLAAGHNAPVERINGFRGARRLGLRAA